jgi:NadR type nicotinamide-nucleotide adenylyltransferase
MIRVCFHGAESTGKSVLAAKLSAELGVPWVPEYGREWAETKGTDFTLDDLLAIAAGQDSAMRAAMIGAAAANPPLLLLDTDPLMTAAWAAMLFGHVPAELMNYPKAERYLLFVVDTDWIDDGTRFFGSAAERALFEALAEDMLVRAGVAYERISGSWEEREAAVRAVISALLP